MAFCSYRDLCCRSDDGDDATGDNDGRDRGVEIQPTWTNAGNDLCRVVNASENDDDRERNGCASLWEKG